MIPASVQAATTHASVHSAASNAPSAGKGDSFASLLQAAQSDDPTQAPQTPAPAPAAVKPPADAKSMRDSGAKHGNNAKPATSAVAVDGTKPAPTTTASADPTTPATPAIAPADPTDPAALALAGAAIVQGATVPTPTVSTTATGAAATLDADSNPDTAASTTPPADPTLAAATQAALSSQIATTATPPSVPGAAPRPAAIAAQANPALTPAQIAAAPPQTSAAPNAPPPPAVAPPQAAPAAPIDNGLASALTLAPPKPATDDTASDTASNAAAGAVAATGDTSTASALMPGLATTANSAVQDAGQPPSGQTDASQSTAVPAPAIQVAVAVMRGIDGNASQGFTMQLRPDRLGTVDVQLDVDSKGRATATFRTDKPETLQLLQQDSSHLLKALNDAGVNADASSLNFSLKDAGSNSFAEAQERRGANGQNTGRGGAQTATQTADETPAWRPSGGNRLYDIHA